LIREYLEKKFKDAGIDAIGVERNQQDMTINILAAKPGAIIGRNGEGLEEIKNI
jgi:small subunit ribosomal protein S3